MLDDAVVDFVFVAMMHVVEQVKMLLFIANVEMFFFDCFFFSHSNTPPDSVACTDTHKRRNLQGEIR
jgi:hypothetical protein